MNENSNWEDVTSETGILQSEDLFAGFSGATSINLWLSTDTGH